MQYKLEPEVLDVLSLPETRPDSSDRTKEAIDNKIMKTQRQVDEVVGLMRNNISKIVERGEKLDNLADRAEALQIGTQEFQQAAHSIKRNRFWKAYAMYIAVVGTLVLLMIAGIAYKST